MLKTLHKYNCPLNGKVFDCAGDYIERICEGHLDKKNIGYKMLKKLHKWKCPWGGSLFAGLVSEKNNLELLKKLDKWRYPFNDYDLEYSCNYGNIDCHRWLVEKKGPCINCRTLLEKQESKCTKCIGCEDYDNCTEKTWCKNKPN